MYYMLKLMALAICFQTIMEMESQGHVQLYHNEFKARVISPQFLLTDKDFAQISASQTVLPNTKVQLCHWHL